MYYNIEAVIKNMSYDELVKILKEQNTELLYLKGGNKTVKGYFDLVDKNKELYDELNRLATLYNTLRIEYMKLKGKTSQEDIKEREIESLRVELEAVKEKTEEDIKAVKSKAEVDIKQAKGQEIKNLEAVGQYIDNLEKNQFKPNRQRGSSLSKHKTEAVIKGICKGLKDSEISKTEGIDRKTVKKIRTAGYKSKKTNQKILAIINRLLQINQNIDYIKKLKDLKSKYMSQ